MKKFWILFAAFALALPMIAGAQQQSSPGSSEDPAFAAAEATRSGSLAAQNHAHPVVGAPTMELGVDHARSSESQEDAYQQYYESRQQEMDQQLAAEERIQSAKDAKHQAYVDQMKEMYPGWYY